MMTKPTMTRWKATIAYDGTGFNGWQSQPGGNTIQDFLEARLATILDTKTRVQGSGRTDSGVHAAGQVCHFDADWKHGAATLQRALRTGLPAGIQVQRVSKATAEFHARFSAKGKRYRYRIFTGWAPPMEERYNWSIGTRALDLEAMQEAAKLMIGEHDFSAFAALRNDESDTADKTRHVWKLDIHKRGPRINIVTEGNGYLYKMVRSMVGAITEVGFGKLSVEQLKTVRDGKQRTKDIPTAPAKGLSLDNVFY